MIQNFSADLDYNQPVLSSLKNFSLKVLLTVNPTCFMGTVTGSGTILTQLPVWPCGFLFFSKSNQVKKLF